MKPICFGARELKPYAEPVIASELKEGGVYFFVTFLDDAMLIPTMEPMVFVGRDLDGENERSVYFQDIDSYRRGIRYNSVPSKSNDTEAKFYSGSDDETGHIFQFEQGLEELMRCALRRQTATNSV